MRLTRTEDEIVTVKIRIRLGELKLFAEALKHVYGEDTAEPWLRLYEKKHAETVARLEEEEDALLKDIRAMNNAVDTLARLFGINKNDIDPKENKK